MQIISYTNPKMIIADEGKHLRDINDVYVPEYTDEYGNVIPEHIPSYSDVVFVPYNADAEEISKLYVEEEKGE